MSLFWDLFGVLGLVVLLIGFVITTHRQTKMGKLTYDALNFVGAIILCIYAIVSGATIFIALEAIWAIIAIYFVYKLLSENSNSKINLTKKKSPKKKKK